MAYRMYYPQRLIDLQQELATGLHPKLDFVTAGITDVPELLGHIAAYCGISVDGWASEEDIQFLAERCTKRLREIRATREDIVPTIHVKEIQ